MVPLTGVSFMHRDKQIEFNFGFNNSLIYFAKPKITFEKEYFPPIQDLIDKSLPILTNT